MQAATRQGKPAMQDAVTIRRRHGHLSFSAFSCIALWITTIIVAANVTPLYGVAQNACAQNPQWIELVQKGKNPRFPVTDRETAYEKALAVCPQIPVAYDHLVILLLQQQNYERALAYIHRGLEMTPHDPSLTLDLGVALLSTGKPEEALPVLKGAPLGTKREFYLAMTYRALRNHEASRQALAKSLAIGDNDPYVFYVLIEQDRASRDKKAGLRDFQAFYQRFPHSAWLHLLLGNAYTSRHNSAGAESEYRKALQFDPQIPIARFQLGRIAFDGADYAQALQDFKGEIRVDPTFGEAYLYAGTSLRRLGKNDQALPYLEKAAARDPNNALAYGELAVAQVQAKQLAAAMKTLQHAERRFPEEAAFPAQLAGLLKKSGNTREAEVQANLAEALSQKNNTPLSDHQAPVSKHVAASVVPPAMAQLRQCVEHEDARCASETLGQIEDANLRSNADYLNLKAEALNLLHRDKRAIAAIQQAIKIDPHQASYFITQGQIYQKSGNQITAIQSFLHAEQMEPGAAAPVYDLGMSFFLIGNDNNDSEYYKRAARHFQTALDLDPHDVRAEFMLGVVNSIEFKLAAAKKDFEGALKMDPHNPYYHLHYGMLLSRSGDLAGARREMNIAEGLDPSYARTYLHLGAVDEQTKNYTEARKQLEAAVRLDPHLSQAYYTLGRVYYHLGLTTKAHEALQKFQQMKSLERKELDPVGVPMNTAESRPEPEG